MAKSNYSKWVPQVNPEQTTYLDKGSYIIRHEYTMDGAHRLVIQNKDTNIEAIGEWAGYTSIAKKSSYSATTPYYDGVLPEIFQIDALKHHVHSQAQIDEHNRDAHVEAFIRNDNSKRGVY